MKAILHQIAFVVATAATGAACFGADTLPPPNQSAQTPVGDYGSKEALVIEGNQTFSKDRILGEMAWQIDYHLAAHPAAPLADYLVRLERMITLGYRHAGFPEVTVKAVAEPNAGRVVVQVNEGPRFRCGEILLSGVKTMTNEVVRQKIADVLGGLEIATGSQSNLDSIVWHADHPAPLDEVSQQSLTKLVQEALAALNYYRPKVSVRIVPDPARKLADLKIEIADEGIKGTVAEIEVSGLYTNTRPQLLEYLKLKPGMEVTATLVAATSNQLWRSARFFRHDVSLVPLPPPGQFKLMLDLDEVREAPPLTGEFSPKESALLKFRDWLAGWETRPEDMVVSISFSNASLRGHANLVFSPSGTALTVSDTTSNGPTRLQYALVASEKLIGLYSVWRRSKFTIPRAEGLVLLKITPSSPKSYGKGNISFGVGLNAASTQPFRLEMDLQPAVFLSMAHWMDSSLKDDAITLTQPSEDGGWEFRINAATGRLLRATAGSLGSDGLVTALHPEEEALARLYKEIAATTADHANRYLTNRGFSSWSAFAAEELMESPMIGRAFGTEVSRQIETTRVLIRQFLGQQNLDAVFEPLDRIFADKPENDDEEGFIVPMSDSAGDARANPMAGFSAGVLRASDTLLPRHSWPWVLLRESAFTAAGQAKYTQTELDKLLKSDDIGPAGCLATAYLLGRINPRLARAFAERGLTRLTPAEFHRDYRLLLRTNSIVGDLASNALGLLEGLGEARLTMLAAGLGTDESAFARDLTRLLLDTKGQPPGDAVWPAFEQHWDKVPRHYLEVGLRRFLPQVQYLTNSQALYERGLMLISPDSPLQDFDEAGQCFRKAADQGHAGAQLQFGALCERGQGVSEDFAEAMSWYRKAEEKKEPHAACHIGALYHEGKGVPQDPDEAAKWYRLEADGNCARAQFSLGRILEAKLDTDAAVKWYRRAAEGGATAAQARLGDLLSEGLFSTPDYVEACQWLSLAAQAGDKMSEIRLRRVKTKLNVEQLAEVLTQEKKHTETAQAATRTNASNIRLVTKEVSLERMPAVEGTSSQNQAITLRTKDSSLVKVPLTADLERMVGSPDVMHVAFPVMRGGKWVVNLDGIDGPKYDQVRGLKFSPDGKRLAYQARRGRRWVVVVDGKESTELEELSEEVPVFSPDSKRFIHSGWRSDSIIIVEDGQEVGVYDTVATDSLGFSPDSRHSFHVGMMGKKSFVIMDGVKGPEFDGINEGYPMFSPDSRHWVYVGLSKGKSVMVKDGAVCRSVRDLDVAVPIFSPDGQRLAYVVSEDNDWRVVVDEKVGRRYDTIVGKRESGTRRGLMYFSPDSRRLAYVATRGDRSLVVVDEKEEAEVDDVWGAGGLLFSPDSQRVAYACKRRGKWMVVLDGKEGPTFDGIGDDSLRFSPDSKRFVYAAGRGDLLFVVIDGIESRAPEEMLAPGPVFSPDSRHVAYAGGPGGKDGHGWFIVDGQKSEPYNEIRGFRFENSNLIRAIGMRYDASFNKEFLRAEIEIREK